VSVRFEADNRWGNATFATYSALPIVELRLEADVETAACRVPANRAWTPTKLMLKPGDRVEFSTSGAVEAARADQRAFYHQVSPDGRNERFDYLPQSDLPALVLMGRIGNGPAFAVGKSLRLEVGPQQGSGELWLGINDDNVNDNSGEWLVQITMDRGTGSTRGGNGPSTDFDEDLEIL
jgi:hypothetical protein